MGASLYQACPHLHQSPLTLLTLLHKMYFYKAYYALTLLMSVYLLYVCVRIETYERRDVWPVTLTPMESGTLRFAP